jgi:hypothetical protein
MALREPDRGQGAEMLGPDAEEAAAQIVEILKARGLVEG